MINRQPPISNGGHFGVVDTWRMWRTWSLRQGRDIWRLKAQQTGDIITFPKNWDPSTKRRPKEQDFYKCLYYTDLYMVFWRYRSSTPHSYMAYSCISGIDTLSVFSSQFVLEKRDAPSLQPPCCPCKSPVWMTHWTRRETDGKNAAGAFEVIKPGWSHLWQVKTEIDLEL